MTSYLRSCYHCIRMYRGEVMAVVTVRNLPAETHRVLRVRAARNGRSTEPEIRELLESLFESPILPFDQQAARAYAPLVGRARAAGQIVSVADGQIAAIATLHGFAVATRDTAPFVAAGVPVINPWETQ